LFPLFHFFRFRFGVVVVVSSLSHLSPSPYFPKVLSERHPSSLLALLLACFPEIRRVRRRRLLLLPLLLLFSLIIIIINLLILILG
jgi:hypothetical protein